MEGQKVIPVLKTSFVRFHNMQSIFMILDLFDRLSQAILSEQKCEKNYAHRKT